MVRRGPAILSFIYTHMNQQSQVKVIEQVSVMKKIGLGIALSIAGIAAAGFFAVIAITSPLGSETPDARIGRPYKMSDCVYAISVCQSIQDTHPESEAGCWAWVQDCISRVLY